VVALPDHSPFKVICTRHNGVLIERGRARPDGSVVWQPREGRTVPESGRGVHYADRTKTVSLLCRQCGKPKAVAQVNLVRLLQEGAQAG
jgi:hypothetical protein